MTITATQISDATAKIEAASTAVLAAQTVGAVAQASGADKMQAALTMAGALSPALPPQAAATVTLLQLIYNMYAAFKHPAFVAPVAAPAPVTTQTA